jgi:protein SCO1/2
MQTNDTTPSTSNRQKRGIWTTVATIIAIIALFLGMFLNKMLSPRVLSEAELRANGAFVFDQPRLIEDFALVDHQGNPFTLEDLKGKWTIAFFGFTHCPDVCPTTMAVLGRFMKSLDPAIAEQTQVILVSVDPGRDTPEKLAEYVPFFHEDFVGVTGDFLEIMSLTRDLGVAFSKVRIGDDYTVDHSGNLALISPEGLYRAFYKPPFDMARLKLLHQSIVTTY